MEGIRITRTCKEKGCNKPFSISQSEANWLKEKGLELFSRCSECRKKRREIKKDEQSDISKVDAEQSEKENMDTILSIIDLTKWVCDRQSEVMDLQMYKSNLSEEEHEARESHINDLGLILSTLLQITK